MSAIASTSGRLHSEFVRLLFLQAHRESDRFFAASGVLSAQSDRGFYHHRRAGVSDQLKSKVGLTLAKAAALRITLNLDGAPIISRTHTPAPSSSVEGRDTCMHLENFYVTPCFSHDYHLTVVEYIKPQNTECDG
jgi:hypothetical protein